MAWTLLPLGAGVVLLAALPALLSAGLLNASIQMLIAALFVVNLRLFSSGYKLRA